jgi:hypothetical protein
MKLYADRCRHFNGIQHDRCKAGVNYLDVRDESQPGPYRWPCLTWADKAATTECSKRSLLTQVEHAEKEEQIVAAMAKADADIAAGKCHVCGAASEPSRIIGRCKYAACGHRVGQVAGEENYP